MKLLRQIHIIKELTIADKPPVKFGRKVLNTRFIERFNLCLRVQQIEWCFITNSDDFPNRWTAVNSVIEIINGDTDEVLDIVSDRWYGLRLIGTAPSRKTVRQWSGAK